MTVTGRHVQVSERFRRLCAEKLTKVEQYAPRTQRIEVVVSEETSRGAPKGSQRVEITCLAKGPVIRAEAYAEDKYTGLDLALAKLAERMRRVSDRRKVSRRRGGNDVSAATADLAVADLSGHAPAPVQEVDVDPAEHVDERLGSTGDCPVHVREKVHRSAPMTLDQALNSMELVGHDFFLYHDKETDRPSVVYRRRGWDYGVIHLDVVTAEQELAAAEAEEAKVS
nr:ribosome-associated translation inhibitor RaiA [Kineosphaera limosa]